MDPNGQKDEGKKVEGVDQQSMPVGMMGIPQHMPMMQPDMNDPNMIAFFQQQQFMMNMMQGGMPSMLDGSGQPIQQQPFYGYPGSYAPQYQMIQPFYQPQPMGSMMPVGGSAAATQVVGGFSGPFVGQQQQDNGNGFQKRFNRGGFQGGNYGQGGHHRGGYAGNIGSGGYQGGHQGGPQRTGGPSKNDVQKYKTQICRHFDQHGTCTLGDSCVFAHGPSELRNLSDPIPPEVLAKLQIQAPPSAPSHYSPQQPSYQRGGAGPQQQRGGNFGGQKYHTGGTRGGFSKPHGGPGAIGATHSQPNPQMHHQPKEQASNYKTSLCKNFSQGSCKYGNNCSFAHGDAELKKSVSAGNYTQQQQPHHHFPAQPQPPAPMMQPRPQPQPGNNLAVLATAGQSSHASNHVLNMADFPSLGGQPNAQ